MNRKGGGSSIDISWNTKYYEIFEVQPEEAMSVSSKTDLVSDKMREALIYML